MQFLLGGVRPQTTLMHQYITKLSNKPLLLTRGTGHACNRHQVLHLSRQGQEANLAAAPVCSACRAQGEEGEGRPLRAAGWHSLLGGPWNIKCRLAGDAQRCPGAPSHAYRNESSTMFSAAVACSQVRPGRRRGAGQGLSGCASPRSASTDARKRVAPSQSPVAAMPRLRDTRLCLKRLHAGRAVWAGSFDWR